eukprot:6232728-Lingulodinium_polyedra.AAC.1
MAAVSGQLHLLTDSRYVRDGVTRLRGGADPTEWKHADLWEVVRVRVLAGGVSVQWIPAHRTAEDYAARGIEERHRVGNASADAAAGGVAAARAAP